ncbi:hypothetical protein KY290_029290 [Solanum tuberosum]|uniref:Uncharacterized protein n=1 Tax=Solanum tuberosum TaxID=4113 RepID=A0ABQ7ULK9_SOLTU|nr:hypothetical protein KY284_028293 [Solanum tuberosum]KAH0750058.1 hypothetical protein KY290_029290 [Solanum tuberosum]
MVLFLDMWAYYILGKITITKSHFVLRAHFELLKDGPQSRYLIHKPEELWKSPKTLREGYGHIS